MLEIILLAVGFIALAVLFAGLTKELNEQTEEVIKWQKAYVELATELELTKLGVMNK